MQQYKSGFMLFKRLEPVLCLLENEKARGASREEKLGDVIISCVYCNFTQVLGLATFYNIIIQSVALPLLHSDI